MINTLVNARKNSTVVEFCRACFGKFQKITLRAVTHLVGDGSKCLWCLFFDRWVEK